VYLYGYQDSPGVGPLQGGNLTVEVGGNQVASITNVTNGSQAWTVYQYSFTATSTSTVLSFQGWQGPDVNALAAVSVTAGGPTVNDQATPSGANFSYGYSLSNLSGTGDVFIPIIDPSAIVKGSLPQGSTLIEDPATIAADWPGALPVNMNVFDDPIALLEIPENGDTSLTFSFLDRNAPLNGPLLANGIMIDPQIPGLPVPEPSTWAMMLLGFAGLGLAGYRTSRRNAAFGV
jgi:hypothetical protein